MKVLSWIIVFTSFALTAGEANMPKPLVAEDQTLVKQCSQAAVLYTWAIEKSPSDARERVMYFNRLLNSDDLKEKFGTLMPSRDQGMYVMLGIEGDIGAGVSTDGQQALRYFAASGSASCIAQTKNSEGHN